MGKMIFAAVLIAGFIAVLVLFLIWLTRKVSAHIQQRFGPMRVGRHLSLIHI